MKVIVGEHKCTIDKTPVNELEVNVTKVEFEFDEKIPASYAKKAFFTQGNVSKEVLLENNECDIPSEVLYQKGQVRLGVIAYEVQNGELIERFNPTPTYFPVWEGSLTEADNTEPITPTDKEQIESAIANIQAEQATQNEGISQNTSNITSLSESKQDKLISGQNIKTINNESLLGAGNLEVITDLSDYYTKEQTDNLLDDKADRSEIPDVSEFITKDVDNLTNYTKTNDMNTAINTAVGNERASRESSDVALQNQIDAITASSDVVDVVSTYQDLLNYSTASLTEDDIIKVMQDESHSNAISYFRWQLSTWVYIGSEGPFYTKGETDTLLNNKANVSDLPDLTDYVKNTDYATSSKGGVIKVSPSNASYLSSNGILIANVLNSTQYESISNGAFIGKGTLENVITGKRLINQSTLETSQAEQDTTIEGLQAELERYKLLENALPHTENETESDYVTLENTAKSPMEIETIPQTSQETTTGAQLFDYTNVATASDLYVRQENGYITITFNNQGSSDAYYNYFVGIPNIQNSTDYNIFLETKQVSGSGTIYVISSGTGAQFPSAFSKAFSELSANSIINVVKTSNENAETEAGRYGLRTFVRANAGQSGSLTFRISVIANTSVTPSNFVYENFTGALPSPNPDYPQEIHRTTGENQVKVVGKNLFDSSNATIIQGYFDGSHTNITSAGTNRTTFLEVQPNTTYTISTFKSSRGFIGTTQELPKAGTAVSNITNIGYGTYDGITISSGTITAGSNDRYIVINYSNVNSDTTAVATIIFNHIQIETGSTATSFTPYEETTYPISLGDKEMYNLNGVYDGFVYDEATDKFYIERKIGKVVLDGSETWNRWSTNVFYITKITEKRNSLANYFRFDGTKQTAGSLNNGEYCISSSTNNYVVLFKYTAFDAVADWKTWLSSHNINLIYEYTEPTLEEITDTTLISQLRAIKDALSMQGATHIISTSSGTNLPFLIKARAVQNISNS